MTKAKDDRPTVRVKPNRYQPTKAEMNEPVVLRKPDGSVPTPEEVIRAAFQPARVVVDSDA